MMELNEHLDRELVEKINAQKFFIGSMRSKIADMIDYYNHESVDDIKYADSFDTSHAVGDTVIFEGRLHKVRAIYACMPVFRECTYSGMHTVVLEIENVQGKKYVSITEISKKTELPVKPLDLTEVYGNCDVGDFL